jgi:hypothetical protein
MVGFDADDGNAELAEVLQQVAVVARHLDHVALHAEAEIGRHPLGIALGVDRFEHRVSPPRSGDRHDDGGLAESSVAMM